MLHPILSVWWFLCIFQKHDASNGGKEEKEEKEEKDIDKG